MSRKKGKPPASVAARAHDGFNNLVQKSGIVPGMNSVSAGQYNLTSLLSRNRIKLEAMYRQNWITGSMVDSVAEDMTRAGMDLSGDVDPVQIEGVQAAFDELKIWDALLDTIKWARLYGGAVAIIQIEGQDLTSPLRAETIGLGQFQGLAVYDRWMVQPDLARMVPSGPDIGLPMYYRVVSGYDATSQTYAYGQSIHYTRLIRQIGIKLPP